MYIANPFGLFDCKDKRYFSEATVVCSVSSFRGGSPEFPLFSTAETVLLTRFSASALPLLFRDIHQPVSGCPATREPVGGVVIVCHQTLWGKKGL